MITRQKYKRCLRRILNRVVIMVCLSGFVVSGAAANSLSITTNSTVYLVLDTPESSVDELRSELGQRVFFNFGSYEISSEAELILNRKVILLKEYVFAKVRIEGNISEDEVTETNDDLGIKRAKALKDYFASNGISPSRISVVSNGTEKPILPPSVSMAWPKNRNAECILILSTDQQK